MKTTVNINEVAAGGDPVVELAKAKKVISELEAKVKMFEANGLSA